MQAQKELTPKEKAFVEEYLKDFNQSKAALRAGYGPKGAGVTGHRLMQRPAVAGEVAKRLADKRCLEDLSGIDVPRVVREVARIAFAGDGEDDGGPEVKPADRLRALDMLAKHLSLYEPGEKAKEAAGGVVILPEVLPEEEGP